MQKHRNRVLALGVPAILVCAGVVWAVLAAAPGLGADDKHFVALRMVRFSKPVAPPDFTLKDLKGNATSLSHFKGKVVVLNFWTTS